MEALSPDNIQWQKIGILGDVANIKSHALSLIGLFKVVLNNKIVFIGMARETERGGFRKRLMNFVSPCKSARSHPAGEKLHANKNNVEIYVLPIENRSEIVNLRNKFIKEYNPLWNANQ